ECLPLDQPFDVAIRHIQRLRTHIDPYTKTLHPRSSLLMSIRLPDPVPSRASLVDAGSALRASDTPRCSRRGREATLIHKLEASGARAACPGPFLYPEARHIKVQGAPLGPLMPRRAMARRDHREVHAPAVRRRRAGVRHLHPELRVV